MLRKLLNGQNVYLDLDDDQSGGTPPPDTDTDESLGDEDESDPAETIARLNKRLADFEKDRDRQAAQLRRKYEREQKVLKKQLEELQAKNKSSSADDDDDDDLSSSGDPKQAGSDALRAKRMERQLEALREKLEKAEEHRTQEISRRRALERDQQISQALDRAGCLDNAKVSAHRHFLPQIVWDDVDEGWVFETLEGNAVVSIIEGIVEELPDYFKAKRGKSGSGGGNATSGKPVPRLAKQRALDDAKKQLSAIEEDLRKNQMRGRYSLRDYRKQKSLVTGLEKDLASK